MFGQSSSLFGSSAGSASFPAQGQPASQPSLFGNTSILQSNTQQRPAASSSLWNTGGQQNTLGNAWGSSGLSTTPTLGGQASLFPAAPQLSSTVTPSSSLFGTSTGPPQQQQLSLTQPSSVAPGVSIPPEVQVVLSNLSNADARSYNVLTDIFQRLKALISEPPVFIAFTYELDSSPQSLAQKRAVLEDALVRLNKPSVIEAYNATRKANPDATCYAVVPIEGFSGITKRCELQVQSYERLSAVLQDLQSRQELVRNHMEIQALKRIKAIRKRHERLQSTVIDVVGMLEEYALSHSVAQLDVAFLKRLKGDISSLSAEVHQSAAGRLRLNETALKLRELALAVGLDTQTAKPKTEPTALSTGSPSALLSSPAVPELSESSYKQLKRLLQKQEMLFDTLATSLRADSLKAKKLLELAEADTDGTTPIHGNV